MVEAPSFRVLFLCFGKPSMQGVHYLMQGYVLSIIQRKAMYYLNDLSFYNYYNRYKVKFHKILLILKVIYNA